MKKIIEIYDISDEYQNYQGNPYVVVLNSLFETDKEIVENIFTSQYSIFNSDEWYNYKKTILDFNNNDAKHRMRKEQPIEYSSSDKFKKIKSDEMDFDNNSNVTKAINMLSPQPKSRFIKYYLEEKTYKEIALEEGKHISTIQESIKGAKKKFLKYLNIFENTPEK